MYKFLSFSIKAYLKNIISYYVKGSHPLKDGSLIPQYHPASADAIMTP
jgi:hypothetical protein